MSPAERRFWLAAQRRAAGMQPELHRALLRAFQIIRDSLTDAELTRIIDAGQLDRLLSEAFNQAVMDRAFIPVRDRIRQQVQQGFKYAVPDLPKGGLVNGALAVMFDHLSPNVIVAIRTLETKAITSLSSDIREAVRAFVENGLRDGVAARTIAKQVRPLIGMSPTQVENAIKYEQKLRDAGVSAEKIAKQVEAYRKRAIALNANTNAKTITLDSYKRGNMLAWEDARAKGMIPQGAQLTKTWKGIMDDRERPEHVALENETVLMDEPYPNGEMVPGDSTYNCRCISIIRVA